MLLLLNGTGMLHCVSQVLVAVVFPTWLSLGVLCDSLSSSVAPLRSVSGSMQALSVLVCIHVLLCCVYQGWGF